MTQSNADTLQYDHATQFYVQWMKIEKKFKHISDIFNKCYLTKNR